MIDYLSIIGDASDNIPGVKGVWPKWAIWLIQKYKTLESVYEHIDEISASLKEKLLTSKDAAMLSKSLIVLMDVPVLWEPHWESFALKIPFAHFRDVLINQYQFNSMEKNIRELQDIYEKPQQTSLFG
jgi:DNA polymerase-1